MLLFFMLGVAWLPAVWKFDAVVMVHSPKVCCIGASALDSPCLDCCDNNLPERGGLGHRVIAGFLDSEKIGSRRSGISNSCK